MNILNRSALRTKNGLPYFEIPELARLGWLQNTFLTRKGGVSVTPYHSLNLSHENGDREEHLLENSHRIATAFHFDPDRLILLQQSHFDQILLLREPFDSLPSSLAYDAMITNAPNTFLGILTADCVPIFVADQRRKVVAAIHAGRNGTALHITTKVLRKMEEEFGCSRNDFLITLGPSIGFCCYEIDAKVYRPEWQPFSMPTGNGRWLVDLARINIALMEEEGIQDNHIFWIDLCTSCNRDLFFSYRKEGETGRQLSFIGITEPKKSRRQRRFKVE